MKTQPANMNITVKQFMALFKAYYLQLTDLEYKGKVTGLEARMIFNLCDRIKTNHHAPVEYLLWLFTEFLPNNEKFCPPTLKFACSGFALYKFLYEKKDFSKKSAKKSDDNGIVITVTVSRTKGKNTEAKSWRLTW